MIDLSASRRLPAYALRLLDALRVGEIALGVGLLSLGVVFALDSFAVERLLSLAWYFVGSGLFVAAVYFLNSYWGYQADLENRRFDGLERTDPRVFLAACLPATVAFIAILGLNNLAILSLALAAFALWALYSWPMVGIKAHPLLGAAIHFVAQLLHFFMGWLAVTAADTAAVMTSVYIALLFVAAYLHHLVIDYEADARTGGTTPLSRATLGKASFAVFSIAAAYWAGLGVAGMIPWWQVAPFVAAFVLQAGTWLFLRRVEAGTEQAPLRYRRFYRMAYGAAVIVFVALRVHHG